jgi:glycosyltransferase involved in cell wall biosynthesis
MKVLLLSHGHPSFSIGGAEIASYNLHQGLNALQGCESHYLARVGPPISPHKGTPFLSLRQKEREALIYANHYDYFRLSNRDLEGVSQHLVQFVRNVAPDVVHFHHILGFGVESLYAVRKALPNVPIVVTLHEYLSICNNHGQMVKTKTAALCHKASPADCAMCFPEISPARFMKRELFLKSMMRHVDMFVSPSRFLIERYADWGLPRDKMVMLENGLDVSEVAPPRTLSGNGGRRGHFGYFGQLNQFKGIKVLIEAVARVPARDWGDDAMLNVFGGNLEVQPEAFQREFRRLVANAGRRVRFFGSYKSAELPRLIREIDWVVIPSTWWENSPVVIQEAFLHGRPIITSDIGGMAEKVRHNVNGLQFRAGSAESLVDRLTEALRNRELWDRLRTRIPRPLSSVAAAEQHVALYEQLLSGRVAGAQPHLPAEAAAKLRGFVAAAE